jgi:5-(aminomethyl)-3-furanmethanol phosphate kinase
VTPAPDRARPLTVIKVGGALASIPGALERVCAVLGTVAREHRVVIVPGGGPFANAVRQFDRTVGVSPDAAHWMAILSMDQYAHVLAERIPGAVLAEDVGALGEMLEGDAQPVVLAPSRWMRSADVFPHSWEVTSDTIAAFIAGALDASQLILVKATSDTSAGLDPYFSSALPAGMPHRVIGSDRMDELEDSLRRLRGDAAGPVR